MREAKRRRLESNGWTIGSAYEFLRLSDREAAYIELKLRLAESLRKRRRRRSGSSRLSPAGQRVR
jgi:hypothetical protein